MRPDSRHPFDYAKIAAKKIVARRAEDRTLTIEEVDKAHQKVLEALTKANLTIR